MGKGMNIKELWGQSIEEFGDNAYLMFERYNYIGNTNNLGWICFANNNEVEVAIDNDHEIRRKISAALPFNLERAKNGDAVEHFTYGSWFEMNVDFADLSVHRTWLCWLQ
jgi:hypothetical protein